MKLGRKRFWICFLCWMLMFHSWLIVRLVPGLRDVFDLLPFGFILGLLWINIPGLPLAQLLGEPYFQVKEFGALPQGPVAYGLIALFWTIVATALAEGTSFAIGWFQRRSAAKKIE